MKVVNIKKSWSKYGTFESKLFKIKSDWYCQTCSAKMPKVIDPFIVPLDTNSEENYSIEYIRICPICYSVKKKRQFTVRQLFVYFRREI